MTLVVPFAAGSSTDTAARILTAGLSDALGQQVIVENIGGAAGMTGTVRVARAAPDGYTLLFGTVDTIAIAPALQKTPPYDSINDFVAAGMAVEQPVVLITRKDLPVNSLADFVAPRQGQPQGHAVRLGRRGIGFAFLLRQAQRCARDRAGARAVSQLRPGRAGPPRRPARLSVRARRTPRSARVESGQAKGISLLTAERSALFPNLATSKEQGVAGVDSLFLDRVLLPEEARPTRSSSASMTPPTARSIRRRRPSGCARPASSRSRPRGARWPTCANSCRPK